MCFCRLMVSKESYESIEPIEVKVLPFQQTSQPEAFNIGIFSSATFMGMIFVLVPVSLAVDMVYDREVSRPPLHPHHNFDSPICFR